MGPRGRRVWPGRVLWAAAAARPPGELPASLPSAPTAAVPGTGHELRPCPDRPRPASALWPPGECRLPPFRRPSAPPSPRLAAWARVPVGVGAGLSCLWSPRPVAVGGALCAHSDSPRCACPGLPAGRVHTCLWSAVSEPPGCLSGAPFPPPAASAGPAGTPAAGAGHAARGPPPASSPPPASVPGSGPPAEAPADAPRAPAATGSGPSAGTCPSPPPPPPAAGQWHPPARRPSQVCPGQAGRARAGM